MSCMREESGRRHWGVGKDRRLRNPRKKTQCKGSDNAPKMVIFCLKKNTDCRWKSKTIWERSGCENIHLFTGQPWMRRRRTSSRRTRRVSTAARLVARVTVKHGTISCQLPETTCTVITLNQESNFTCREKSHSHFHYDILTWPGPQVRPWM